MIENEVTVINKLGLHARAAAKFVTLAGKFSSDIQLQRNQTRVNAKSIMGVMMLAASKGTVLTLLVDGDDEVEACEQLITLIKDRFGEDE